MGYRPLLPCRRSSLLAICGATILALPANAQVEAVIANQAFTGSLELQVRPQWSTPSNQIAQKTFVGPIKLADGRLTFRPVYLQDELLVRQTTVHLSGIGMIGWERLMATDGGSGWQPQNGLIKIPHSF